MIEDDGFIVLDSVEVTVDADAGADVCIGKRGIDDVHIDEQAAVKKLKEN